MKSFNYIFLFVFILSSCSPKTDNRKIASEYLAENGYVSDNTIDQKLTETIEAINILAKKNLNKYFVLDNKKYNPFDTSQILIVPFRKSNGTGTKSGFSVIEKRLVFICPLQIKEFVFSNSLSDTADISGYLGIILLHELSHYALGVSGSFDENKENKQVGKSQLGDQNMWTEPEILTAQKRLELKVDSLAVEMVKQGIKITDGNCFNVCMSIQLAINGAEFMLFGKRIIENFGSKIPKLIRDKNWTHPNLELRLAFMNYYLNPTLEKQIQINDYLYQREVEPIHRQETDPRIYQGERKVIQ